MNTFLYRNIGSTDVTITVLPANENPSTPGIIQIDSEQIHYQSCDPSNFFGCTRGYNSTTAASHSEGATVVFISSDSPVGEADLVGTTPIVVADGTNVLVGSSSSISIPKATGSVDGYLSHTDWTTFNNKLSSLTIGNLTDAGTDGFVVTGGTGAVIGSGTSLAQHVADSSHNGYLSQTDWSTFNGKQAALGYTPVNKAGDTMTGALGIGESPDASSILDAASTTQGFLPPRMTTTQRTAISSPAEGLVVYDTTLHQLWEYQNGAWAEVGGGGGGTPGGSPSDVQFNSSGSFGGDSSLTWDDTNKILSTVGVSTPTSNIWQNAGTEYEAGDGIQVVSSVLLDDGTILAIMAGNGNAGPDCNVYNPNTDVWTPTGSLSTPRVWSTLLLLGNNKVLCVGGDNGVKTTSVEIYDPVAGTWSAAASYPDTNGIAYVSLVNLGNGTDLAVGGNDGSVITNCYLYTESTGLWSPTGSLHHPTWGYANYAYLSDNGTVYAITNTTGPLHTEAYNISLGTWTDLGTIGSLTTTPINLFVYAGTDALLFSLADVTKVYRFNATAQTWNSGVALSTNLSSTLFQNNATMNSDGNIVFVPNPEASTAVLLYNMGTDAVSSITSLPATIGSAAHSCGPLVFIAVGGSDSIIAAQSSDSTPGATYEFLASGYISIGAVAVPVLPSDPASPPTGGIWFNTTYGKFRCFDGTNIRSFVVA